MHIAAKQGQQNMIKYLIGKEAKVDIKDNDGVSACDEGKLAVSIFFLSKILFEKAIRNLCNSVWYTTQRK